jgi:Zn-dependent protease
MWDIFLDISAWVLPVLLAVVLHEVAHGWVAGHFGDPTARQMGRLTLNPLKHIDPVGTVVFPALLVAINSPLIFGSAKPVPVDFSRLNPPRLGMAAVALAGPVTNILLALAAALLLHIDTLVTPEQAPWLFQNLYRAIMINCVLASFNLLPILPLDGGRVVTALLTGRARAVWSRYERFGLFFLIAILLVPAYLGYGVIQQVLLAPTYWLLEKVMLITGNG